MEREGKRGSKETNDTRHRVTTPSSGGNEHKGKSKEMLTSTKEMYKQRTRVPEQRHKTLNKDTMAGRGMKATRRGPA